MDPAKTMQAHGLTHKQIEEIGLAQKNGEVNLIPANNAGKGQINDPYFKEDYADYKIPDYEEKNTYHVAEESRQFKAFGATPERMSVPKVNKYNLAAFKFMQDNHGFEGKIVHILHDPTKASGDVEEDEDEGTNQTVDYNRMTVADLRKYIEDQTGQAPKSNLTKAELIALITGDEE